MKKKFIITIVLMGVLLALIFFCKKRDKPNINQTNSLPTIEANRTPNQTIKIENKNQKEQTSNNKEVFPSKYLLDVPFAPQAPFAYWDQLHEEACEEASLILIDYYWQKKTINPDLMEKEIIDLVKWEEQNGYKQDVTIEELAKIAKDKYGYKAKVDYEVTKDKIKQYISEGKPVIAPMQGQDLKNPFYKQPGPPYHMLVIIGFDKDEFITNDVGTKRGKGYRYSSSVLINAIHNWTWSKETVREGRKVLLIVEK